MEPYPFDLATVNHMIVEREQAIKDYKAWLAERPEANLVALCLERSIPVRATWMNRLTLLLAKKNELQYYELCRHRAALEDLQAQQESREPEVYDRPEQLNCSLELLEPKRYHLFCAGQWQYSFAGAALAMRFYHNAQRIAPVTMLAGRRIVFYSRRKPSQE